VVRVFLLWIIVQLLELPLWFYASSSNTIDWRGERLEIPSNEGKCAYTLEKKKLWSKRRDSNRFLDFKLQDKFTYFFSTS